MQLLSKALYLGFEVVSSLLLTVLRELCFQLLTASRDAFSKEVLIFDYVLAQGLLFELKYTAFSHLIMSFL